MEKKPEISDNKLKKKDETNWNLLCKMIQTLSFSVCSRLKESSFGGHIQNGHALVIYSRVEFKSHARPANCSKSLHHHCNHKNRGHVNPGSLKQIQQLNVSIVSDESVYT